jgi:prepilin-type N-terminal cleavage/methylation domain-containing protein
MLCRTRNNHRGFSLVELLIVIAIISVIATITIPILLVHATGRLTTKR